MSLPRFFDSVFWSIRFQQENEPDQQAVRAAAEQCIPRIRVDTQASRNSGTAEGVKMLLNLCARTFGAIQLDVDPSLRGELVKLATAINPDINLAPKQATITIACSQVREPTDTLSVGGSGWTASVSRTNPVGITPNRAAGLIAGALAYGELFKDTFASFLAGDWEPSDDVHLSLLTYEMSNAPVADATSWPIVVPLGEIFLVGIGAVGMAALAALRTFPVSGRLHLIDNQKVDLSNLQRYVLAFDDDVQRRQKVDVGHREAKRNGLTISVHGSTWERFLADWNRPWRFVRVVTALDSAFGRQTVQAALPKEMLNGGVTRSVFDVGRYGFDGQRECLNCAYQNAPVPPLLHLMMETFGLSPPRIQQLEDGNLGLTVPDVRAIEAHVQRPGELGFLVGQSLRSAYMRMCGFVARPTLASNEPALVPAAHVPVLCGLLLGLEIVKASVPELRPFRLEHLLQFDARYALGPACRLTQLNLVRRRCICTDARYQAAYAEKWPNSALVAP